MAGKDTTSLQKTFREHVEVIVRRRWFLIIPLASVVIISLIISIITPNVYESMSLIRVNDKKIMDPLMQGLAVSPDIKGQIDALSKDMISWPRLIQLAEQFKLIKNKRSPGQLDGVVAGLKKRITVEMKENNVIQISFQDTSPTRAQQVVNTIARNFINESARIRKEEARNAINFIGEQLKIYRSKLEDSERNFSTHKINADLLMALNRKKLLESQMASAQRIVPSQVRMEQNPVVARLQQHLAELQMELSRLMLDAKEEHPRVIALRNEIDKVKSNLDAEIKKETVRESISMVNPMYTQVEQELKQLNMEISFLEKRKQQLEESGQEDTREVSEEEIAALETGKKVDEDIYQMLLKQIESAYVSERLQDSDKTTDFTIIEYARLPNAPVKPKRGMIVLMGLFLGTIAGLGGVFTMEYLDRSFRTAEDAKKYLKLQFLGSTSKMVMDTAGALSVMDRWNNRMKQYIEKRRLFSGLRFVSPHIARPLMKTGIAPQVVMHHDPKSSLAEEYRIIRTHVQGLSYESVMKTILLTSTVRGEGKSTTSANLAVAMADSGKDTLIIDCDMRKGVSHELLNIAQAPGLSDIIAKGVSVDSALITTRVKHLTALSCGNRPANPSELLGSAKMESLLNSLKAQFDVIILDAPPVLNLPDSCVLGKYADGVVLIVQAERTQREDIMSAHAMLLQAHSNIVGFVLTNVQYHIPKYVYNYLYGT
jgi:capsular exopolysaccharide synthesis family protein